MTRSTQFSPAQLLQKYVAAHNHWATSGDVDDLSEVLHPAAAIHLVGGGLNVKQNLRRLRCARLTLLSSSLLDSHTAVGRFLFPDAPHLPGSITAQCSGSRITSLTFVAAPATRRATELYRRPTSRYSAYAASVLDGMDRIA